ncbi:hypothetical protein [Caballeronia sp. GAWG1-5s-s]|uniref:hypothetical protein n=1 Tax=Caballeronia sp. GAWG1-5s-s TaxID=2921743 RepID=UPI002028A45C|nr:hypothetical protein [Caballeronia sp. GAWG1-5s-s]
MTFWSTKAAFPASLRQAPAAWKRFSLALKTTRTAPDWTMYAVAIARGHVFNDGNKRTDLASTVDIEDDLVEVMVEVAEGKIDREELADYLAVVCMCS